jgi:hypothetical protein
MCLSFLARPYSTAGSKEIALADLREIELAQKKDALILKVISQQFYGSLITKAQQFLLRQPVELSEPLAVCTDQVECAAIIEKMVMEFLAIMELADGTEEGEAEAQARLASTSPVTSDNVPERILQSTR